MATPQSEDELENRIRIITRSGRAVRPPVRYEPDPDQVLEDDFTDASSDDEWGFREEAQTEDGNINAYVDDEGDEDDITDFTDTESHDSSYISSSDTCSSSSEEGDEAAPLDVTLEDAYLLESDRDCSGYGDDDDDDDDDILEWDTLTVDASDRSSLSEDDQDL